ncbi:hypothetical protein L593_14400 [Salinarchaeum sp. Harcht-Bsk1]|uniref:hypothetical protein n=1 Tax=Salinarchaeum sp. Harcht-Bsk1 TaxID=1333523 RepID=UPI00034229D5|nr:hypothetical protein [Salinarchaeum sp. Harcht-Bsk1]AGN02819.1 hypothetical protein L593_14400 [Salinarchaeum sp. Harcht-Bsk1]
MVLNNPDRTAALQLLAVLLMAVALVGSLIVVGAASAQEQVGNSTVPGVDAGENRTVTVEIHWNASADAANDSASVAIEHVTSDGTVNATTTDAVPADPGTWTYNQTTVSPAVDVDHFDVNVTATNASVVDDVQISDDAAAGGGAVSGSDDGSTGILGGIILLAVLVGGALYVRDA